MNDIPSIDETKKKRIRIKLLSWFGDNERDFPWRRSTDPYEIFLAEKLLQQTAVRDYVVNAYTWILGSFPTIAALSKADEGELSKNIEMLGLSRRAGEMIATSRKLVEDFGGGFPSTLKELKELPGVGEYIGRAILCFAMGNAVAMVDTNVGRWLFRVAGVEDALPSNPARNSRILHAAQDLLPRRRARDFNLAIIDLCAAICTPKNPRCSECPIAMECSYGISIRS